VKGGAGRCFQDIRLSGTRATAFSKLFFACGETELASSPALHSEQGGLERRQWRGSDFAEGKKVPGMPLSACVLETVTRAPFLARHLITIKSFADESAPTVKHSVGWTIFIPPGFDDFGAGNNADIEIHGFLGGIFKHQVSENFPGHYC
jgi:hypothetical protein